jgi:Mrp family chromosome partitioning ATPase
MLNMEKREVHQCDEGWLPVFSDESQSLAVMSIGFLLNNDNEAVVWRGPKKTAMIKQFLSDVAWGERDVLIIDTPPGTSDEHITIMEALKESATKVEGAVVVTTPQAVAVGDVRRELTFCKKTGLNVIGVVENMSGYVCPNCSECTNIFSKGGGEALAEHAKVPFLGCVPIDPNLCRAAEKGDSYVKEFKDSPAAQVLMTIADRIK